jgi:hypothetical protein
MAALAGLEPIAHGGVAGAIVEALVVIAVASVFVAVFFRERRAKREPGHDGHAVLRDRGDE